jgi:hypothetical protein
MLTVLEYGFHPPRVEARLLGLRMGELADPSLAAGVIWSAGTIVGYTLLPLAVVLLWHREGPRSVGWHLGGFLRHSLVYLGLYLFVMAPILWWVSRRPDFLATYPFVRAATSSWRSFAIWESVYLVQFLALESFFRGYLLFTLERAIGKLAVFVMLVPYCMIHYHKPPLEALAAIVAGGVLGALALRYRSWYGGALLHVLVAATMDATAAHRAGLF